MYRASLRAASRPTLHTLRSVAVRSAPRRFASTASPVDKPRTWKSSGVRLALAGGAVYFYSTSAVFADEALPSSQTIPAPDAFADDELPTVEGIVEEKRKQTRAKEASPSSKKQAAPATQPTDSQEQQQQHQQTDAQNVVPGGSPADLEEEAGQQGAFNPETGEINWDCPCLGGMADGPCGEQFKTAFSCFVYSEEEPKGMDCIEKFQGMQECFKEYPEIYGAELQDDADEGDAPPQSEGETPLPDSRATQTESPSVDIKDKTPEKDNLPVTTQATEEPIPAKWDDATAANDVAKEEQKKEAQDEKNKTAEKKE